MSKKIPETYRDISHKSKKNHQACLTKRDSPRKESSCGFIKAEDSSTVTVDSVFSVTDQLNRLVEVEPQPLHTDRCKLCRFEVSSLYSRKEKTSLPVQRDRTPYRVWTLYPLVIASFNSRCVHR